MGNGICSIPGEGAFFDQVHEYVCYKRLEEFGLLPISSGQLDVRPVFCWQANH